LDRSSCLERIFQIALALHLRLVIGRPDLPHGDGSEKPLCVRERQISGF
jgi:hypothetical protein